MADHQNDKIRVLFVCLGNICRSPLAEGVFRHLVRERGLEDRIEIDSAGTGSWHVGSPPDQRMLELAQVKGISLEGQLGRQFSHMDFDRFTYILTMDRENLEDVLFLGTKEVFGKKVWLFRQYDPDPGDFMVPDPYYGGRSGFERVYEIVDRTCRALLDHIVEKHGLEVSKAS